MKPLQQKPTKAINLRLACVKGGLDVISFTCSLPDAPTAFLANRVLGGGHRLSIQAHAQSVTMGYKDMT